MSNTNVNEQAHRGTWQALRVSFEAATERLPQALQAEGFGVITQIDLQQTFKARPQAFLVHSLCRHLTLHDRSESSVG